MKTSFLTKPVRLLYALSVGLLMAAAPLAHAQPVTVPDFSFENIDVGGPGGLAGANAGVLLGNPPNWDMSGNAGGGVQSVTNGDGYFDAAALPPPGDGTNYAFENFLPGDLGYCWQDIGALQANTIYTATIAVGETLLGLTGQGFIALVNGQGPFQTILASTPVDTTSYTAGTFSNVTVAYTTGAQAGGDLTILMEITNGAQLVFDNVRLNAAAAADPTALLPVTSSAATSNSIFTGAVLAQASNTVYVGNTVTLSEDAAGAGPFTYQWLSNNGVLTGANSSALSVSTASYAPNTTVQYAVVVTDGGGASTSAPVSITAIAGAPVIFVDTYPTLAGYNVGDSVTFTAAFLGSGPMILQWLFDNGTGPVQVPGATGSTLTLTNLQSTSAGSYSLVASNSFEAVTNDPGVLSIGTASTNDADGVVVDADFQDGLGGSTIFTPTWPVGANSLLAGLAPTASTPSAGAFQYAACGGLPVLTDGKPGSLPPAGNASSSLAAAGAAPGGYSVTYALPTNGAPYGWTITNITVYGGWADAGRIEQEYDIFYSTYASPGSFSSQINAGASSGGYAGFDFQYPGPTTIDPNGTQCATRVVITSTATNGLVQNAAGLQFFFQILAKPPENAWEGYGEIQAFGYPSAPSIVLVSNVSPQNAGDVVGSAVTITTEFSASSPLTYQWMVNTGGGPLPVPGATNNVLNLSNIQLTDTGSYTCVASNSSGSSLTSGAASLTVNSDAAPDGYGAIDGFAYQESAVPFFYPTWTIPAGDLILNATPLTSSGQFNRETASGLNVLTTGFPGGIGSGNDLYMATGGNGNFVTYLLPTTSSNGWTITNIAVFGGWSDQGRDENECIVYYSTVFAPDQFTNGVAIWDFPAQSLGLPADPTMTRVTATGAGGPLASNVAGIEVVFNAGENGYEGYSQIYVGGFPSASVGSVPPALDKDIIPSAAIDVVGSSVTFTASFSSTAAIDYQWYVVQGGVTNTVPGGNASSLTLNNLTLGEAGAYFVVASNSLGEASSSTNSLTVNPAPTPSGSGITEAFAYQRSYSGGPELVPTWTLAPGDLLEGLTATSHTGNFQENGDGPISVLTDGLIGYVGGTVFSFCSCGINGNGSNVVYTLPGSASGISINQIVTYGGWQDGGRDQQEYTVSYATVGNPSTFVPLTTVNDPANTSTPSGAPNMTRVTIASPNGPLANNVVAVKFDFTLNNGGINNWQGYSELAVYGQSTTPLSIASLSVSAGNLNIVGTGGIAGTSYTIQSATSVQGPWSFVTGGTFGGTGGLTATIPINHAVAAEYYRIVAP